MVGWARRAGALGRCGPGGVGGGVRGGVGGGEGEYTTLWGRGEGASEAIYVVVRVCVSGHSRWVRAGGGANRRI